MLDRLLRRRRERFAPAFYEMHVRRLSAGLRHQFGCLGVAVVLGALAIPPLFWGSGSVLAAAVAGSILVLALVGQVSSILDMLSACVLPFFEEKVGGTDTFLAGKALLWHSRALDETASRLGVTPLSDFASGDPLILGESQSWFSASDLLATTEALLADESVAILPAPVVSDLAKLRDAMRLASDRGTRTSLHLREGNSASFHEMEMRGGSYF